MTQLPSMYRVAVMSTRGRLQFEQRKLDPPPRQHVTIKVEAVSICDADAATPVGMIPGHEVIGTIVQVPPEEQTYRIGDRVGSGYHSGHCHACRQCRQGKFILCENQVVNGQTRDGCFGEYATLRTESLARIPAHSEKSLMSAAEIAPLLCPGVTVYNGIRNLNLQPNDFILIQGIGSLGHLAIQFASRLGLNVIVSSRGSLKRKLALDLGANEFIDSQEQDLKKLMQDRGGVKAGLALAPNAKAIAQLVECLEPDGVLGLIAIPDDDKLELSVRE
ncbi:hypothetical protein ACM66B_004097 [Microbotryomycetes sp. NB124-2]